EIARAACSQRSEEANLTSGCRLLIPCGVDSDCGIGGCGVALVSRRISTSIRSLTASSSAKGFLSLLLCSSLSCSTTFSNWACSALICFSIKLARSCRSPRISRIDYPSLNVPSSHLLTLRVHTQHAALGKTTPAFQNDAGRGCGRERRLYAQRPTSISCSSRIRSQIF